MAQPHPEWTTLDDFELSLLNRLTGTTWGRIAVRIDQITRRKHRPEMLTFQYRNFIHSLTVEDQYIVKTHVAMPTQFLDYDTLRRDLAWCATQQHDQNTLRQRYEDIVETISERDKLFFQVIRAEAHAWFYNSRLRIHGITKRKQDKQGILDYAIDLYDRRYKNLYFYFYLRPTGITMWQAQMGRPPPPPPVPHSFGKPLLGRMDALLRDALPNLSVFNLVIARRIFVLRAIQPATGHDVGSTLHCAICRSIC
ncbi:MAG: hypothetical protein Q9227_006364 [Pyrenula ochraceoflavens]